MPAYAEVAVQLPVAGLFSYAVPERMAHRSLLGTRVLVPFGNRGVTGVVVGLSETPPPEVSRVRELEALLDARRLVSDELISLCRWVAQYYEAPPGEVLRAALPAGTSITASQIVALTQAGARAIDGAALPAAGRDVLVALAQAGGRLPQRKLVGKRTRVGDIGRLLEAGYVSYELAAGNARVKARSERVVRLAVKPEEIDWTSLARSPKRASVLRAVVDAAGEVAVRSLTREIPTAAAHLRALSHGSLVHIDTREVTTAQALKAPRLAAAVVPPPLTDEQQSALSAVCDASESGEYRSFLLHGITGSGKTEVYLHAIAHALNRGKTAIVLVPEISLTPQLSARFRARFGDQVAVLHSALSDRQRYDEWHRLLRGEARIALGARSAVFAPVRDLGVIVVDEEHDSSFKQEEGVRYHARDVALVRAHRAGAVCLLGSATPSLESFAGSEQGRHVRLELTRRATDAALPQVEVLDLRRYRHDPDTMLSAPLRQAIEYTLQRNQQAILFLNRRGFATFVMCGKCGHAFRCDHCSVSLTYHLGCDRLLCHYCGFRQRIPDTCPGCGEADVIMQRGLGTEKIAEGVATAFPGARVARLDRDTASGNKIQAILERMANRSIDILVGTQMVTKGHDFPGVTLVGVLCADTGLSLPDFRATERTFQLLTQVAGRAGRGEQAGRVMIQTYRPTSVAITAAAAQDYAAFYSAERAVRAELGYPPFGHLAAIRIDGAHPGSVQRTAQAIAVRAKASCARAGSGVQVLGPCEAPLARLRGRTRWHLWLQATNRTTLRALVRMVATTEETAGAQGGVRVAVDVDPVSAL